MSKPEVHYLTPEGGNWGIYDRGMIAMLTKAVQEQQALIDALTASVHEQRERITVLESKII
jgi:hypothetical protein